MENQDLSNLEGITNRPLESDTTSKAGTNPKNKEGHDDASGCHKGILFLSGLVAEPHGQEGKEGR